MAGPFYGIEGADIAAGYRMFVENGYAVMVQDVRGKYGSEGAFDVWRQEAPDGEDTLTRTETGTRPFSTAPNH